MKSSAKSRRLTVGFLALILLAGWALIASWRMAESARERRRAEIERAELRQPEPVTVRAEPFVAERQRRIAATLEPWRKAAIPAEESGRVSRVFVEAGDSVTKGQPLIQLDSTFAQLAASQAQARLEEARRLFQETERLRASRAVAETAYQAQAAAVRLAELALAEARERLERHTVRAPFDGKIVRRLVEEGEAITTFQPVAELAQLDSLRVVFDATQSELPAVQPGTVLPIEVPAFPSAKLEATVRYLAPAADETSRMFRVEAEAPNTTGLPGGLTGTVLLRWREFENFPFIPAEAVEFAGGKALVWKITPPASSSEAPASASPTQVTVRLGPEIEGRYPVLEGLSPGDLILLR